VTSLLSDTQRPRSGAGLRMGDTRAKTLYCLVGGPEPSRIGSVKCTAVVHVGLCCTARTLLSGVTVCWP